MTLIKNDKKYPKSNIGDHVTMSWHKNIFAKGYTPNRSEGNFVIKKLKTLFPGNMLFVILMVKKLLEHFMKRNCKKQIKKSLKLRHNLEKR